jgi:hypothetical protein
VQDGRREYVIRRTVLRTFGRWRCDGPLGILWSRHLPMATKGWTEMDPLGTLLVSLGALIVLDLAALQLGGPRRARTRTRATRSR